MTPHNKAEKGDIAEIVLCPGDPLRAKYIAENFLEDYKLINDVRNMFAYTGYYKGKRITVFPSGMGIPSMGIYCYELYKFYDVEHIIRIGSCGAYSSDLNLFDTILVNNSYTFSNFALALTGVNNHLESASLFLNSKIEETFNELDEDKAFYDFTESTHPVTDNSSFRLIKCNSICSEIFDYYCDTEKYIATFPKEHHLIAAEMEASDLFATANYLGKNASCLLTVVDSHYKKEVASPEQRETSLNNMIKLALETALKL